MPWLSRRRVSTQLVSAASCGTRPTSAGLELGSGCGSRVTDRTRPTANSGPSTLASAGAASMSASSYRLRTACVMSPVTAI